MPQTIYQVDAFTAKPFAGNPAAVCLLARAANERWMQAVATEMNLSETAYLVRVADDAAWRGHESARADGPPSALGGSIDTRPQRQTGASQKKPAVPHGFNLRWFTPAAEVSLCGHATLASAHVLWETGELKASQVARFHTLSGVLTARRDGDWIEMDFPAKHASAASAPDGLIEALGRNAVTVARNNLDYLVELASEAEVRTLAPDISSIAKSNARGVIVTARADRGRDYDFISRFFAPRVGVNEDPVTGSAHCCLAPFWAARLGRNDLLGFQASARGGFVRVGVRGDRVLLAGQAVTVMTAELADIALAESAATSAA